MPLAEERARALPIAAVLPGLRAALQAGRNVVIEAPPGAGKTSIVPLVLLDELPEGEIVVLQPRRIAARLSAQRVASLLGEPVGERVGYQVRFEQARSARTRVMFMTEGVLLRRLREDADLRGVAAVVLDEFHERHLDGDIALALLRRVQLERRPELRLLAMSATLDGQPIASFLAGERLASEGRSFPVEIEYMPARSRVAELPLERQVAQALHELVERGALGDGHVLVFLPGAREIRLCTESCAALASRAGLELLALHGELSREQQDRAVGPSASAKLILSTNVAETSITIDGVVAVIDGGLARIAGFDPSTGLPRLSLGPISRASAAQRAGRAGRTRAGVCVRLYGQHDHDHRPEFDLPEVRRLDLAGPLLELAAAGVRDPASFPWFEAPPSAALALARELLLRLQALHEDGSLTETGAAMLRFPVHPRLARVLVEGERRGVGELAALAAALLGERPLLRSEGPIDRGPAAHVRQTDADLLDEIELIERLERGARAPSALDRGVLHSVERAAKQLRGIVKSRGPTPSSRPARETALRQCLLAAHPDRVAKVRSEAERRVFVFAFGGSAELGPQSGVRASEWALALRSEERREGTRRRALVGSACAIEPEWLLDLFPDAIVDDETIGFDGPRARVIGESSLRYGKLAIESSAMKTLPPERAAEVLFEAAKQAGAARFCPEGALDKLRSKIAYANKLDPSVPLLDDATIEAGLRDACTGKTSFAELEQADLIGALRAGRRLDRLLPESMTLPGGRKLEIHYEVDRPPWVASRLQDFFGMREGPKLLEGKLALVMHLQAPNRHDVAVTSDLARFWSTHYAEVRKQLMRRYPRHDWPEDPLAAAPPNPNGRRRG
ncbi:ATP-dependent helicase HrpB [Nannocystaceae bacterium ST9]